MSEPHLYGDFLPKTSTVRSISLRAPSLRLDPKHYQEEFTAAVIRVEGCGAKIRSVSSLAAAWVPGRTKLVATGDPSAGAPYLRAHDCFEVRLRSNRFVSRTRTKQYDTYRLQPGMLLTPSSGRNLGPVTYVGEALAAYAMTDILRIVPNDRTEGLYLYAYLLTPTGQALIRKGRTGTTVDHLSPDDVLSIPVVWLEKRKREEIAERMRSATSQLDKGRKILDRCEDQFHASLNLPLLTRSRGASSAIAFSTPSDRLLGRQRLDAAPYHPDVMKSVRLIQKGDFETLATVADLRILGRYKRYYVNPANGRPILSGRQLLQLRPVNLQHISSRSFSSVEDFALRRGWTVFTCDGRAEEGLATAAYVHSAWDGWLASNHIMRAIPRMHVHPGYLYLALRSPHVSVQLKARATGSVVDALEPETVGDVTIPMAPKRVRNRLGAAAVEAWERIAEALRLQNSAIDELEEQIRKGYEARLSR